jgi:branched-chain amino acid transport system ATP-binding protein
MLEVQGLHKQFGGVQAVRGLTFSVNGGECVALIGPNGAGKSTTFACIAGQHPPSLGQVVWRGHRLDHLSPAQRLALGVARTFQVAQIFEALTVLQNVQLALRRDLAPHCLDTLSGFEVAKSLQLLSQMDLTAAANQRAMSLSYGAKKRLEMAIALGGIADANETPATSALLLLDEPAAGLALSERAALMRLVKSQAQAGHAVLYTEHNMDAVFGVADRVLVLIEGAIAAQGTPEQVARDPLVRAQYLGKSVDGLMRQRAPHA